MKTLTPFRAHVRYYLAWLQIFLEEIVEVFRYLAIFLFWACIAGYLIACAVTPWFKLNEPEPNHAQLLVTLLWLAIAAGAMCFGLRDIANLYLRDKDTPRLPYPTLEI